MPLLEQEPPGPPILNTAKVVPVEEVAQRKIKSLLVDLCRVP